MDEIMEIVKAILKGTIPFMGLCIVAGLLKSPTLILWVINFNSTNNMWKSRKYESIPRWYPQRDCIKPQKYKFLFKGIDADSQYIPKEIYYNTLIQSFSFAGYTIFVILGCLLFGEIAGIILSVIYSVVMFVIDNYFDIKIYRKKKEIGKGEDCKEPRNITGFYN